MYVNIYLFIYKRRFHAEEESSVVQLLAHSFHSQIFVLFGKRIEKQTCSKEYDPCKYIGQMKRSVYKAK